MRRIGGFRRILALPELDFLHCRFGTVEKSIHAAGKHEGQGEILENNLGLQGDFRLPAFRERTLTRLVSKHAVLHGTDIRAARNIFAVQREFDQCANGQCALFQMFHPLSV